MKYSIFQRLHRLKAQQRQTKRERTEENVTEVDKLVLCQNDRPQIHRSTLHVTQSVVVRIQRSLLEVFKLKGTPAEELTEANCETQLLKTVAE